VENIYKNFYDLVDAISGFSGNSYVYPAFPDIDLADKADYPIIIIGSPEISWSPHTFGKNVLEGTIAIDIYTTAADTVDQYTSDIHNQIEINKGVLATQNLRQVNLSSTTKDIIQHGDLRIHFKTLIFEYKFYFTKTSAY
jgi:hypothetical protein